MKNISLKFTLAISLLFALFFNANANTIQYLLKSPEYRIANSLYNQLSVYDARDRKSSLGIKQLGKSRTSSIIVSKTPITGQIEEMYAKMIETENASEGQVVLQLVKFDLVEIKNGGYEKGYFDVRALMYEKKQGRLWLIDVLDKNLALEGRGALGQLVNKSSQLLTDFITRSLYKKAESNESILDADLANLDQTLKNKLPLYKNESLTEGVYTDWESFKNQTPTFSIIKKTDKQGNVVKVSYIDHQNRKQRVKPNKVYAYVISDEAFLVTNKGHQQIFKVNNDFQFDGKIGEEQTASQIIAQENQTLKNRLRIDPLNGGVVQVLN